MGAEGEAYSLTLSSGERMSGKVLCRVAGRDLALSWEEQNDSILALRTLPSPRADRERVVAICWSKWGATEPGEHAVEGELKRALERLSGILAMSGRA
jgi:tRNA pseudouridine-54 N-methylase